MSPDNLLSLVQALRERIGEHRSALSSNEMLTRYALVDPLLCETWLGHGGSCHSYSGGYIRFRTRTPRLCAAEQRATRKMVIEAKKLGSGLQNGARQAIDYAMDANRQARYFAITDGQHWEIYDTNRPASDMRVASFNVMATSPAEVCLKAMALWRQSVECDSVMPAETPIVGIVSEEASPLTEEPPSRAEHANAPQSAPNSSEDDQNWIPISEFWPEKEDGVPAELRFPDGNAVQINKWFMLLTETVRWLYNNRDLTEANPRVQSARSLIVSDSPFKSNGQPFQFPKSIGPLHVETHGHRYTLIRRTRNVITNIGQDTAQFKVRLSS